MLFGDRSVAPSPSELISQTQEPHFGQYFYRAKLFSLSLGIHTLMKLSKNWNRKGNIYSNELHCFALSFFSFSWSFHL